MIFMRDHRVYFDQRLLYSPIADLKGMVNVARVEKQTPMTNVGLLDRAVDLLQSFAQFATAQNTAQFDHVRGTLYPGGDEYVPLDFPKVDWGA